MLQSRVNFISFVLVDLSKLTHLTELIEMCGAVWYLPVIRLGPHHFALPVMVSVSANN